MTTFYNCSFEDLPKIIGWRGKMFHNMPIKNGFQWLPESWFDGSNRFPVPLKMLEHLSYDRLVEIENVVQPEFNEAYKDLFGGIEIPDYFQYMYAILGYACWELLFGLPPVWSIDDSSDEEISDGEIPNEELSDDDSWSDGEIPNEELSDDDSWVDYDYGRTSDEEAFCYGYPHQGAFQFNSEYKESSDDDDY